jgi:predicted nucleic acid-binding protein
VLSESTKPNKNSSVMSWLSEHELDRQYVSAVTLGELYYGVERLNEGRKRQALREWLKLIEEDYVGRIVPLDLVAAACWGRVRVMSPNWQTVDAQLAATALAYGFTLVTRNVKHFRFDGLQVINPWET